MNSSGYKSEPGWMVFFEPFDESGGDKPYPVYFGKYEIHEQIGAGQSGQVRLAYRTSDKSRAVAVKIVDKKCKESQEKALYNELNALRRLDHPNVVKLIDFCENSHRRVIVLELVQGGDLLERVVDARNYPQENSREIIKQILFGIDHCHSRGVVHRDLKLENILYSVVDGKPHIKICDFGLADSDGKELMSVFCGSPSYIAPEVLMRKPYTKAVDVWCVGVISFMLIAGVPPFNERDSLSLFYTIIKGEYKFESPAWDLITVKGKEFISSLLSVNVELRSTCAQALSHPWMFEDLPKLQTERDVKQELKFNIAKNKWKRVTNAIRAIQAMEKIGIATHKSHSKEKGLEADLASLSLQLK